LVYFNQFTPAIAAFHKSISDVDAINVDSASTADQKIFHDAVAAQKKAYKVMDDAAAAYQKDVTNLTNLW